MTAEPAAGPSAGGGTGDGPTVAVVGGGITGLAAAWELAGSPGIGRVVVLEADARLGGKIRGGRVAGVDVELGPDAFLARVPHARELCRELGLEEELVAPGAGFASLWTRGALRRLPEGLVLGVPSDLGAVARSGILGPLGLARAGLDLVLPRRPLLGDASVGEIVTARFGRQVLERLVDPLVGGINAGRSEALSAAASVPQLLEAARSHRSLLVGLRSQAPAPPPPGASRAPVFLTLPAGLTRLVDTLAERLRERGVEIRTDSPVAALDRTGAGWTLRIEGAGSGTPALDADAVLVTIPAPAAAQLLAPACSPAAAELAGIEQSSVVVTTFAFRRAELPELAGTGFLVPRAEGRLMTAATYLSVKWPHMATPDLALVRVSAGRHRDERALRLSDEELAPALLDELAEATGLRSEPVATLVTRWRGAFPQYAVGHLERVARIEAAVAAVPGLELAGAALRGVGVPACIAQGRAGAGRLCAHLGAGARA